MNTPDFAAEFVALALDVGGLPADAGARLEAEIRARYADRQVRILERPPVTLERVDGLLRQGFPVAIAAERLGVHRSTVYRLIGSGRRKSRPAP